MIEASRLYDSFLRTYGRQHWWPAEDRFEIMAGALLVQRTNWANAARAVTRLKESELLNPAYLARAETSTIELSVRCAGFYRSKASRLRTLARYVCEAGGMDALATRSTATLAADLAQLPGVGAETAAAILLYAFERPMLVIDAYLRRLAQRLCGGERMPSDGELGTWIGTEINDVPRLNELHALVVEHGKRVCLKLPRCSDCCVRKYCRSAYPA